MVTERFRDACELIFTAACVKALNDHHDNPGRTTEEYLNSPEIRLTRLLEEIWPEAVERIPRGNKNNATEVQSPQTLGDPGLDPQ